MGRSKIDERMMPQHDVCRLCGRMIVWYIDGQNQNLYAARRVRKRRRRCFVCISQALQAKYHIKMYRPGAGTKGA